MELTNSYKSLQTSGRLNEGIMVLRGNDLRDACNLERAVQNTTLISDAVKRSLALERLSIELIEIGDSERALEIALSIPYYRIKMDTIDRIAVHLKDAGNLHRALEVATLIPDETLAGCRLLSICRALQEAGDIKKAIEVAASICDETSRADAFWMLLKSLRVQQGLEKIIETTNSIPDAIARKYVQRYIEIELVKLVALGFFDKPSNL